MGSQKKKEKRKKRGVEKGKKAHKAPLDPWQEAMVDYTVLRNQTIPTIKEHQSRRAREEEKN